MAWIRLDDDYIYHPKFTVLSAQAFRLWHEGMAYCRKMLTDGLIPRAAMKTFRYTGRSAVAELTTPIGDGIAPLWEPHDIGFKVHDYLVWNRSREQELKDREDAKDRAHVSRTNRARNGVRAPHGTGHVLNRKKEEGSVLKKEEEKNSVSASKRPIFTGQRFAVFEWQLEGLERLLGAYFEDFDLHAWFFDLDARVVKAGQLVPQRDNGAWLLAQTETEAKRRGLPMATTAPVRDHAAERQREGELAVQLIRESDARDAALGIKDGKYV